MTAMVDRPSSHMTGPVRAPAPKAKLSMHSGETAQLELAGTPRQTFGTDNVDAATALLNQLTSALRPARNDPPDEALLNQLLGLLHGIGPTDTVEGMLAVQMVACQHAAMDALRRAMHPEQTPNGRELYLNLANKLMRTFGMQADTLNRGRGRGTVQRVVVERVNVEPGGQALVGPVTTRGAGA